MFDLLSSEAASSSSFEEVSPATDQSRLRASLVELFELRRRRAKGAEAERELTRAMERFLAVFRKVLEQQSSIFFSPFRNDMTS